MISIAESGRKDDGGPLQMCVRSGRLTEAATLVTRPSALEELLAPGQRTTPLLWDALRREDPRWLRLLVEALQRRAQRPPWHARPGNASLVHVALRRGGAPFAAALLEPCGNSRAARHNLQGAAHGQAPIHIAVLAGDAEAVALLLRHGADCRALCAPEGETPLELACATRQVHIIDLLAPYASASAYAWKALFDPRRLRRPRTGQHDSVLRCAQALAQCPWREPPPESQVFHCARLAAGSGADDEELMACARLRGSPFGPADMLAALVGDQRHRYRFPTHLLPYVETFGGGGGYRDDRLLAQMCEGVPTASESVVAELCARGWCPSAAGVCVAITQLQRGTVTVLRALYRHGGTSAVQTLGGQAPCRVMYRRDDSITPLQCAVAMGFTHAAAMLLSLPRLALDLRVPPPTGMVVIETTAPDCVVTTDTRVKDRDRVAELRALWVQLRELQDLTSAHVRLAGALACAAHGCPMDLQELIDAAARQVIARQAASPRAAWRRAGCIRDDGAVARRADGCEYARLLQEALPFA